MSHTAAAIDWPVALPLPLVDYNGEPRHPTIASSLENARIQRRSRYSAVVVGITVRWVLGIGEYDDFKEFFLTDLGNGGAQFIIPLRYPKNSALTDWKARFIGGYTSTYEDHNWMVEAQLDLLELVPAELPTPEVPLNWGGYQVINEEESGGWVQFVEADGHPYYVKS